MRNKILSLLVLLLTAATGAWADDAFESFTTTASFSSYDQSAEHFRVTGQYGTSAGLYVGTTPSMNNYSITIAALNGETITKVEMTIGDLGSWQSGDVIASTAGSVSGSYEINATITVDNPNASTVTLSGGDDYLIIKTVKVYYTEAPAAPDVEVTTNAETGETYFTEASFAMPDYDATAAFDLVRDMNDATSPVAFSGLPEPATDTNLAKVVVKKNSTSGKFEFLNAITIQLIDPLAATDAQNIIEADGITIKVLKGEENISGAIDYDQDNPITLDAFLADTQPGYYWIKAVPTDEATSPYIGTVYSSELLLIKGYEVTVPAGEYVTYFKDEPLYADPASSTDAKLYTISSVSTTDGTATLSDAIATAPSSTPLLVYNSGATDATFLLIPADAEPNLQLTVYAGFQGTLEATQIAASTASQSNYALNGTAFVWVKNAVEIAANKAWLTVAAPTNARSLNITFGGESTGVRPIDNGQLTIDNWYDLSGRKVATPTKKGIYVKNGKKVVVK